MSHNNYFLRWTTVGRWVATLGIGLVVALGYGFFHSARAQDRGAPLAGKPAAAAYKNSASKVGGNLLISKEEKEELDAKLAAATAPSDTKKEDATAVKEADTASILHDIKWLSPHMWAFYAIWVVSLISVSFAVERFLGLRRSKIVPADLAAGLRAAASRKGEFDLRHAQRLCRQYPSAAAMVVKSMLAKAGRPLPEIEQAMTESLEHEATRLYANVRLQNLTFNVAPMLGLAGTVHGMILCFYSTAHMAVGQNKMDALATGIYAALICTLAGLLVAIPAGILSHYFEGRILKLMQQVEDLARSLVPHLERFEGRPRLLPTEEKPVRGLAMIEPPTEDDDEDEAPLPGPKPKKVEGRP